MKSLGIGSGQSNTLSLLSLKCPIESSCPARKMFSACYKRGGSLGTHQLWTGDLERAEVTYASHIIVSYNCRWLVFLKITLGMKMWCYYFRQQQSEWLMWDHMRSVIKTSVAVITCFPSMKSVMKGETKKGVYLNIISISYWRKLLRILNLIAWVLIHKRSSMDSRNESFITVSQIGAVIYLCIFNPLSSGTGLCQQY